MNRSNFSKKQFTIFSSVALMTMQGIAALAQTAPPKANDVTTPLHLMKPAYVTPYGETKQADVKTVLDRMYNYLETATPYQLVERGSNNVITDLSKANGQSIFKQGDFRLISYEWGIAYTGMLEATAATGDPKYASYTTNRMKFISDVVSAYRPQFKANPKMQSPVNSVLDPQALDDAGSMSAAMIKTARTGASKEALRRFSRF